MQHKFLARLTTIFSGRLLSIFEFSPYYRTENMIFITYKVFGKALNEKLIATKTSLLQIFCCDNLCRKEEFMCYNSM